MANIYNRRDFGYTIISRFEEEFRKTLINKLTTCYNNYLEGIPKGIIDKVNDKSSILFFEDPLEFFENTDFPDLLEISSYKDNYSLLFPSIKILKTEFQTILQNLYSLRCKIAHVKGFFTSIDLDKLLELCKSIIDYTDSSGNLKKLIQVIEQNPESVAIKVPFTFNIDYYESNGILNNLPVPDYEYEGGFVGRDDDIREITKLLNSEKFPVITITGAGGVGKTSLALKVIQELTQKDVSCFDTIIWLSAKENKLSQFGIEDIEPTFKSYEDILNTILHVIGFEYEKNEKIEEKENLVLKVLDLTDNPLIIVDNLETVTDERIINFIIDAPQKIKFLITSRKGLGQVERRYELKQLKEREAIFLFRQIAKDKQINSLSKLEDNIIKKYVNKLSNYPLAIKWVIGQVARGRDINKIIDSIDNATGDISKFCFEQIFGMLSENSKIILYALCCFDDAPTSSLVRYVVEIDSSEFDDAIEELILVSLVIPEQYKNEQNEISSKYNILPLTKGFIRQQLNKNEDLKSQILKRISHVENTITASEQAKREYQFSLNNLGAISEEEKISAIFVQSAFQKYQSGLYEEAIENYKKAVEIAPRFSSAYRNWAVMESHEGHLQEADLLMQKASELKTDDPQIWLLWGNIKRKSNKISDADEKYKKAYDLSPNNHIILNAYGQTRSRLGDYNFAIELLEKASESESSKSSKKHDIINRTSIAEALISWSEVLLRDRNVYEAQKKLESALRQSEILITIDASDSKSIGIMSKTLYKFGKFYSNINDIREAIKYYTKCLEIHMESSFKGIRYKIKSAINLSKILLKDNKKNSEKIKKILEPFAAGNENVFRSYPELLIEINEISEKIGEISNFVEGKIKFVHVFKEFVLIHPYNNPELTYIAGKLDFSPVLNTFSKDLTNLKVKFIEKRFMVNGVEKREAKNIIILG